MYLPPKQLSPAYALYSCNENHLLTAFDTQPHNIRWFGC